MTDATAAARYLSEAHAAFAGGRFADAIMLARKAAALDPASPWPHNLIGAAHAENADIDEARAAFKAAVDAAPQIALSRTNYAYALIVAGAFAEAEAELNAALEIDPNLAGAYYNLAWIRKAAPGDAMIAKIEDLDRRMGSDASARILCLFALGKLYDDLGDYDRAFEKFRLGNDLHNVRYDHQAHVAFHAELRKVFTSRFIRERAGASEGGRRAVFIVGMPRCGSSLLEDRLALDTRIAGLGERPEISRFAAALRRFHPAAASFAAALPFAPDTAFREGARNYLDMTARKAANAERTLDKNLLNFKFVGLIRLALSESIVIDCRRNPVDTCLSCYFQRLRPAHDYKFSLGALGRYYRLYDELMAHWRELFPDMISVGYEDVVEDVTGETERIVKLLGLEPRSSGESTPAARNRNIQTSSAFQARQPISRQSIRRWRNYEKHLGPLIDALGDLANV
jgi:tetratricopeptide (TPR) repeat protein